MARLDGSLQRSTIVDRRDGVESGRQTQNNAAGMMRCSDLRRNYHVVDVLERHYLSDSPSMTCGDFGP
jgi:hypothetical protein